MTTRIVVIGAGGMGREVLDIVEAMRECGADLQVLGVVDDAPSDVNLGRLRKRGYSYLGTSEEVLRSTDFDGYAVGVGSPAARREISARFDGAGVNAITLVHPHSTVGSEPRIEPGVIICAGVRATTNVTLERQALLNQSVTVGHDTRIGAYSVVNPGAHISGDVVIEPGVLIGTGGVVLQGLRVGSDARVGASACVTRDIDSGATVVGVPAKPLKED